MAPLSMGHSSFDSKASIKVGGLQSDSGRKEWRPSDSDNARIGHVHEPDRPAVGPLKRRLPWCVTILRYLGS